MKAIILGAGYGTRLVEEAEKLDDKDLLKYIRSTPKPLLEVNGRPIINQLIDRLATSVPSIRIVANNYAPFFNAFNAWFEINQSAYRSEGINLSLVFDGSYEFGHNKGAVVDMSLGFGFGTSDELADAEGCFVLAGDRLLPKNVDLEIMINLMKEKGTSVIGVYDTEDLSLMKGKSQLTHDENMRITSFKEKFPEAIHTKLCPGLYLFRPEDYALIPEFLKKSEFTDAPGYFVQYLFDKGVPLHGYELKSKLIDFGSLSSIPDTVKSAWLER
jgi:glucose-1-phosphate thymidylyltransferase